MKQTLINRKVNGLQCVNDVQAQQEKGAVFHGGGWNSRIFAQKFCSIHFVAK